MATATIGKSMFSPEIIKRRSGQRRRLCFSSRIGAVGSACRRRDDALPYTVGPGPRIARAIRHAVGRASDNKAFDLRTSDAQSPDPTENRFLVTLLAMAGHDLRQPLQLITSAHDVLATMLRNEQQQEELAQAADATTRLAGMLGQLVEALQLHERPSGPLTTPVPLRPILADLQAEFAQPARLKGIAFRVATARGTAFSHPVLLTSILRNLLRNAIDYTSAGGSVSVTCHRRGGELRIDVRDTGVGIRANALATIFEAFRRADLSRADGLGLGLFIAKRAADLLGHRIEVDSVEGRGSQFSVVARAAQSAAADLAVTPVELDHSRVLNLP